MKTFRNGDIFLKGFDAVGIPLVPAPVGMNSVEFKGRPACIYDGWCHVGCPIGALANPQVTYLGEARRAGAEVRPWSTVTRVLTNQSGTRVTGIEYYDEKHQKQTQEASVVVLAAWSAQNPRLLLNSATDKHPKGLGNASSLVGRYMMSHHVANTWAMFDEDTQNHMGTIAVQYMSYERYHETSHPSAFGSSFVTAGFAVKTSDLANARSDLFGSELADYMKRAARNLAGIKTFGEEQPVMENRLELASEKDEFGMPLGRLTHSFTEDAVALWNANLEEGLKVAKASGAKEAWSARGAIPTSHLLGGNGDERCQFSRRQLRPVPRDSKPVGRGTGYLSDRRRFKPDLHHLCAVAARRRAHGLAMGHADELSDLACPTCRSAQAGYDIGVREPLSSPHERSDMRD
jgi:GMC oxidoreductase